MTYKIYIAGPISSNPKGSKALFEAEEERVYRCMNDYYLSLMDNDIKVINPRALEVPKGTKSEEVWRVMMRKSLKKFLKCDALVLMDGWEGSNGARLEKCLARDLGMLIFAWSSSCGMYYSL